MVVIDERVVTESAPGHSRLRLGTSLQLGCLSIVAAGVALLGRANLAPLWSGDSDEPVYVYQARMLAQGHATLAARTHAEFFYPWLFGQRGDRLFSQYQPGWPSIIAVAHLLGDERLALVFAAVAVVVATWFLGQQVAPGSGVFAAALLLLSPIFVIHAGLYLSYLWTAALVTGALGCAVAGVRQSGRVPFLAAGALFGLALFTRPLDASIVALAAGVYVVASLFRDGSELRRAVLWSVVGVLPFLVLTLIYNAHITGSPLNFPLQAAQRLDTFGFGPRAMVATQTPINYTVHVAWSALGINTRTIPRWFAGSGIGVVLALVTVVRHRRRREAWLLVACVAIFPIAYFFWWATSLAASGASKGLGPHYYIPSFTFLAVLAGWTVQELWRRSRLLAGACLAVVVGGSLLMAPTVINTAHFTTALQRSKARPLALPSLENALVVMRADPSTYMLYDFPFLVGDPKLNDRVLYATDRGPDTARLAQQFPTRHLYQFVQRAEPKDDLLHPSYVVEPMHIVTGPSVHMRFNATNSGPSPVVVASLKVDGRTVARTILDRHSHAGAVASFDVVLADAEPTQSDRRPGLLAGRVGADGQVEVDVAFGSDARDGPDADIYARRYFVSRTDGKLALQAPGLQYHRFTLSGVVWARQNVGSHLTERF